MFRPEEVIFAPTAQCNLHCGHCRVTRIPQLLDTAAALAFLEDCAAEGIELVGFSGGEPFLRPDFLVDLSRAAVEAGLRFDRLMTNGVWWRDEAELASVLVRLHEAGFDGTFGLSVDAWHDQDPAKLSIFINMIFTVWGRKDCLLILAVEKPGDGGDLERLRSLAAGLGGELVLDEGLPAAILNERRRELEAEASGEEDPEALSIKIIRSPYSPGADEAGDEAWSAPEWFEDDFCEGPGNVFYVHPDGRVAACCGFANERESLMIGSISGKEPDGYASLLARARAAPHLRSCYVKGLGARRKELEAAGTVFPGKTADLCFFCDWMCARGLD